MRLVDDMSVSLGIGQLVRQGFFLSPCDLSYCTDPGKLDLLPFQGLLSLRQIYYCTLANYFAWTALS